MSIGAAGGDGARNDPLLVGRMDARVARDLVRLAHPNVRNFLGATFMKQALYELAPDPAVLQKPATDASFAAVTAPPFADTRESGPDGVAAKTITPSRLQLPPLPSGASASTRGRPPVAATVRSLPSAKYATVRLSGDQNGNCAPAGPSPTRARARSNSWPLPRASYGSWR